MCSEKMIRLLYGCVFICVFLDSCYGVSTKMDFSENEDLTSVISNSTNTDEEVEVKHTIVVSTKLKNGNRRGLHSSNEGEKGVFAHSIGGRREHENSGEVPIIPGYKSVETTRIRTPDKRFEAPTRPESVFINRNIRDDYDIYPNYVSVPSQWKPSNFYNNINWLNQDVGRELPGSVYQTPNKYHRGITDDGVKDFYCRKCREMSGGQMYNGCIQQRSNIPRYLYETTTPKMKLDGKLAKLN